MKTRRVLIWSMIVVVGCACVGQVMDDKETTMIKTIAQLSNADVQWDGDFVGLMPTINTPYATELVALGETAIPDLLVALQETNQFVVAHILLTQISGVDYDTFPQWNGLSVTLNSDGSVDIKPEQRFELAMLWQQWYLTQPHPQVLLQAG